MAYGIFFVLMRWLHIGSAALLLGGMALIVLSAGPAKSLMDNDDAKAVFRKIELRFRWVLAAAVFGLIVSGVYQWVIFGQVYQEIGGLALGLLSVKVLFATMLFALLWAFQVESMLHPKAKLWRWMNLSLAVLVVMMAGVLRFIRLGDVIGMP
tara:strand:- start:363 stop:821 length:459 start_codon:yes stop_codon:yes gene_type:complete